MASVSMMNIGEARIVDLKTTTPTSEVPTWSVDGWRTKPIAQAIEYDDAEALENVCEQIRNLPGLVSPDKIEDARAKLEQAAKGNAFVMQGGDCAESFDDVRGDIIGAKRALLARQSQVLHSAFKKPIVEIGRIAGQYAKPRSQPFEVLVDGSKVVPFKGHNVNSMDATQRLPDPKRLLVGYHLAATTLQFLTMMEKGHVPALAAEEKVESHGLHTSHEALNLHLEAASTKGVYNTAAEFLWIGERTRALDGAHVEYMRGIRNPIGVKLGPTADPVGLIELMNILNPDKEVGKITLITRMGEPNVERVLPHLIHAIKASGHQPVWMCDPCHGNGVVTADGVKTRVVETLASEVKKTYAVHRMNNSWLGGVHLEQTGEDVTECVDNLFGKEDKLEFPQYRTLCDPRLSQKQAMAVVQELAAFIESFPL